jgi:peptide/nickel transport system substrate-binding protein
VKLVRGVDTSQGGSGRGRRVARRIALAVLLPAALACAAAAPADVLVFASGADLESANPLVTIHPLARQVQRHALFVTLTRLDSALLPGPYLARRWVWSADRTTLTLHLYPGLRWHDGAPTTGRDVAFTFEAAKDPQTGFPRLPEAAAIGAVDAVDDSTVTMRFARPQPAIPLLLSELPLVPEHLLRDVPRDTWRRHDFAMSPVGNGPFRFVRRDPGQRWVFERVADFPDTLGGPPGIRRLVVAVVDEATTKFAGLVSGDLHVAGIAPTMAELVAADPTLRVLSYPVAFSTGLVFNAARPPFDDVRVRRAIDALINRQRIVDVALAGYGTPSLGPVGSEHPWAAPVARPTTVAADSMLDAAGWRRDGGLRRRGGTGLAFTLLSVGSGDNAVEQLVQADLRDHGITVEIRQMELGAFLATARQRPKRFDALLTGVAGDLALSHLVAMFDSRLAGGALDYAGYHDPSLDSLFAAVPRATTADELAAVWRTIQGALAGAMPVSWLYHSRGVQGISRRLNGVRMDLRGELATLAAWRLGPPGRGP